MKRFLVAVVLALNIVSFLFSSTLLLKSNHVSLVSDKGVFEWNKWGLRVSTASFAFGKIDGGGDIALLDNPHSSHTAGLYYSLPEKNTKLISSSLYFGPYTISFINGEREGLGFSYEEKDFRLFCYSFLKSEERIIQKDWLERRDKNVSFLGFEERGKVISLSSYLSVDSDLLFSVFVKGKVELPIGKVEINYGRLHRVLERDKEWESSIKLTLGKGKGKTTFSLYLGKKPTYIGEYRSLSFSSKGELQLGKYLLECETARSFHEGREKIEFSLSLSSSFMKIKVSDTTGLAISFYFDSSSFTLSKREVETKVKIKKEWGGLTLDSKGEVEMEGVMEFGK